MDFFFNELSVKQAEHPEIAKQRMADLLRLYKAAYQKGFKRLRTPQNILSEFLAPNYTFSNWLNDSFIDKELRSLFRTSANHPFIEDILEQKSDEGKRLFEFRYNDKIAKGFGAACLFDSLAVSFDNSTEWDKTSVSIRAVYFSDETDIVEEDEEVKHCCKPSHLDILRKWIETVSKPSVPNGKILWLKQREFFPHLFFCKDVEARISHLHESHPDFIQIRKRLFELENYCSGWEAGSFKEENIHSKVSPESESRLRQFEHQLTILCPDGIKRLFSWHLRFTPGAGRIYFYPDEDKKKIYIGYIGKKIV